MKRWFAVGADNVIVATTWADECPPGFVAESQIPKTFNDFYGWRRARPLMGGPVPTVATLPQPPVLTPDYRYHATVTRVIDGDTLDLLVDCGFNTHRAIRCRLLGVNTPETKGSTRAAGDAATEYTRQWLADHSPLLIQSRRVKTADAFHRYLVTVWGEDGSCLNDDLLATHNAVPFRE